MENRPLKKLKLGPPDVYPQDPKQKEVKWLHIYLHILHQKAILVFIEVVNRTNDS
jgi:hypothetical protein